MLLAIMQLRSCVQRVKFTVNKFAHIPIKSGEFIRISILLKYVSNMYKCMRVKQLEAVI